MWVRLGLDPDEPSTWDRERIHMPSHRREPVATFAPRVSPSPAYPPPSPSPSALSSEGSGGADAPLPSVRAPRLNVDPRRRSGRS